LTTWSSGGGTTQCSNGFTVVAMTINFSQVRRSKKIWRTHLIDLHDRVLLASEKEPFAYIATD